MATAAVDDVAGLQITSSRVFLPREVQLNEYMRHLNLTKEDNLVALSPFDVNMEAVLEPNDIPYFYQVPSDTNIEVYFGSSFTFKIVA